MLRTGGLGKELMGIGRRPYASNHVGLLVVNASQVELLDEVAGDALAVLIPSTIGIDLERGGGKEDVGRVLDGNGSGWEELERREEGEARGAVDDVGSGDAVGPALVEGLAALHKD